MNLCDIKTVKNLLKRYSTDTKKGFGQNFLINQSIPYDIAKESFNYHTSVCDSACVLEIGPGIGALTSELCQRYDKVVAVEIDKSLIPILSETMADFDNLTIVNDDFLKIELDSSAVILEPQNIKSNTVSTVSPSICHEVMGPDAMIFVF